MVLQETADAERYFPQEMIGSLLAWDYTLVNPVTNEGIRLENVSLTFMNNLGEERSVVGTALLQRPGIVHIEGKRRSVDGLINSSEFLFISKVSIDPDSVDNVDLEGFNLYRIDAYISVRANPNEPATLEHASITNRSTLVSEKYLSIN